MFGRPSTTTGCLGEKFTEGVQPTASERTCTSLHTRTQKHVQDTPTHLHSRRHSVEHNAPPTTTIRFGNETRKWERVGTEKIPSPLSRSRFCIFSNFSGSFHTEARFTLGHWDFIGLGPTSGRVKKIGNRIKWRLLHLSHIGQMK